MAIKRLPLIILTWGGAVVEPLMRLTQRIVPSRYGSSLLHCGMLVAFVARVMSAPGSRTAVLVAAAERRVLL
jgi:hypothetical protein